MVGTSPEARPICQNCPPSASFLRRRGVLAAAVALPASFACRRAEAANRISPRLRLASSASDPGRVALTLDACMGAADSRILDVLIQLGLRATLFVTARWLASNPETATLLRERRDLFALENHGERHIPAVLGRGRVFGLAVAGSLEAVQREVAGGMAAIQAFGGPSPRWYRGAAAVYSPEALVAIQAMGLGVAGFSVNADEGASLPAARVAQRLAAARDGDVLIAHVNHPERPSGSGVAEGIARLHARGTGFAWLEGATVAEAPVTPPRARPPSRRGSPTGS